MATSNPANFLIQTVVFTITGITQPLNVVYVRGEEAISTPFWFELQVQSMTPDITPAQVMGKPALLTFNYNLGSGTATQRYINGVVGEFVFLHTENVGTARWNTYRFRLISALSYQ